MNALFPCFHHDTVRTTAENVWKVPLNEMQLTYEYITFVLERTFITDVVNYI